MLFFLFHFKSTDFIGQQADAGQETKKKKKNVVPGRGYIGGGNCHIHHVLYYLGYYFVTKTV